MRTAVARETLDYTLRHKEELSLYPYTPFLRFEALGPILSETEDAERFSELTNYLARARQVRPAKE